MTPEQKALARHAIGLPNKRKMTYRNHFVTGEGSLDHPAWMQMVSDGNAWRRNGSPLTGGDDLFGLTRAGAELALNKGERLCLEDFPKDHSNDR